MNKIIFVLLCAVMLTPIVSFSSSSPLNNSTPEIKKVWQSHENWGRRVGKEEIYSGDFNGDGSNELLFSKIDDNSFIILDAVNGYYENIKEVAVGSNYIAMQGVFDSFLENHLLFIALDSGEIKLYNLSTESWLECDLYGFDVNHFQVFESYGSVKVSVFGDDETKIIDVASKKITDTYKHGASFGVVGYFTNNSIPSVIYSDGRLYNITPDGLVFVKEDDYFIGEHYSVVDINSDGIEELVITEDGTLTLYSVLDSSVIWENDLGLGNVEVLVTKDINYSGVNEILVSQGSMQGISIFDSASGVLIKNITNGIYNNALHVVDSDNDLKLELISVEIDLISIFDVSTGVREWSKVTVPLSFNSIAYFFGDADSDGNKDIVTASNVGGYYDEDGFIEVYDSESYRLKWSTENNSPFSQDIHTYITDVQVADVDDDGEKDVVVIADEFSFGYPLYILDGKNGSLQHRIEDEVFKGLRSIFVADFDGNGKPDLLGAKPDGIYVIDPLNAQVKHQSEPLSFNENPSFSDINLIDINNNGEKEAAIISDNILHIYSLSENSMTSINYPLFVGITTGLAFGRESLLVVSSSGGLFSVDNDLTLSEVGQVCEAGAVSIFHKSISQLGVVCHDELRIYDLLKLEIISRVDVTGHSQYSRFSSFSSMARNGVDHYLTCKIDCSAYEAYESTVAYIPYSAIAQNISIHVNSIYNGTFMTEQTNYTKSFHIKTPPLHGQLIIVDEKTGEFNYVPNAGFIGEDSFEFFSAGDNVESSAARVKLAMTNNAPVAVGQSHSVAWKEVLSAELQASDADGDGVSFEIVNPPSMGTLSLDNLSGMFEYTPEGESSYQVTFEFRAYDGASYSDIQLVTINFAGNPSPEPEPEPEASSSGGTTSIWQLLVLMIWLAYRRKVNH
ncbi:hypothetical protein FLM48_22545 [Shewanella sp. Scap07]|uniref:Ig-like domain-containing protein n=1 Tax=Shewanella sp. Scap07 TaxID=2589987 RepID=UPI0015BEE88B|nr:Ig-like domain-containing protein [Shewanella sp. Scap07]QLE87610.1 hypothetical protein FLM48_22545 [Shewanella sp. Scap07]